MTTATHTITVTKTRNNNIIMLAIPTATLVTTWRAKTSGTHLVFLLISYNPYPATKVTVTTKDVKKLKTVNY